MFLSCEKIGNNNDTVPCREKYTFFVCSNLVLIMAIMRCWFWNVMSGPIKCYTCHLLSPHDQAQASAWFPKSRQLISVQASCVSFLTCPWGVQLTAEPTVKQHHCCQLQWVDAVFTMQLAPNSLVYCCECTSFVTSSKLQSTSNHENKTAQVELTTNRTRFQFWPANAIWTVDCL